MKSPDTRIVVVPRLKLGYVKFLKCGSTTITHALEKAFPQSVFTLKKEEFVKEFDWPVVSFWRDPYARVESAYRYFRMPEREGFTRLGEDFPALDSFEQFIVDVCNQDDACRDLHFRSQVACEDGLNVRQSFCWNFYAMSEALSVPIEHENESPSSALEWSSDMAELFSHEFSDDFTRFCTLIHESLYR